MSSGDFSVGAWEAAQILIDHLPYVIIIQSRIIPDNARRPNHQAS